MGGFQTCNDSVRSIKEYERKTATSQWQRSTSNDVPLTFMEADTDMLDKPYNNPLVIEQLIGDCEVTCILVDIGSSVDLIFKETLHKMEIKDAEIKAAVKPLTKFTSEMSMTIGTIKLPVYVGGITKLVKFVVIDKSAIYNVILGTPWTHAMKLVMSTYRQVPNPRWNPYYQR